jgi:peroxiredoxin
MSMGVADPPVRTGGTRIALGVVGALLATLLVVIVALSALDRGTSHPRNRLIGTRVAVFTVLPGVNRGAVRAPWLSHHPAVLLFFADWCTICHAELPALARSLGTGRLGRTVVVGIDGDQSPSVALSFVASYGIRFAVAQDASRSVASTLVVAFPAAVFVTSSGRIAAVHYGVISAAQVRAMAATLR